MVVNVLVPRNLSAHQRKLLEDLRDALGEEQPRRVSLREGEAGPEVSLLAARGTLGGNRTPVLL